MPGACFNAAELFSQWAAPRLTKRYRTEIAGLLESTDWTAVVPRLLAYTGWRLSRTSRYGNRHGATPDDYVQEAIALITSGQRHYYRTRRKPWFDFIATVIDSLVSGDHVRKEDRIQHLAVTTDANDTAPGTLYERKLPGTAANQEEVVVRQRFLVFAGGLPNKVREYALLREKELFTTAAEYAVALNTTEADIRNRHRVLLRRRPLWDEL